MNRAQHIIKLLEAGGLEPAGFGSQLKSTNKYTGPPKGTGNLKKSQGFEYGSGSKKKNKELADAEFNDDDVDTPVLVGNMFKRDKKKDISLTGLRG